MSNEKTSQSELQSGIAKDYRLDIPIKSEARTIQETIRSTNHKGSPACHFEDLAAFNHTIKAAKPLRMTFLRRFLNWLKLNNHK